MSETNGHCKAELFLALIAGAGVGAIAGLLFAPRSGVETRDQLRSMAKDAADKAARLKPAFGRATVRAGQAARDAFARTFEQEMGSTPEPTAGEH